MHWRLPVRGVVAVLLGVGLAVPPPTDVTATLVPAGFVGAYPQVAAVMRAAGQPYADWAASGRCFLGFDQRGDGTAIEVLGDLTTADRIAVLVPGVGARLADFDRGLGGVTRRAPAAQARSLYDRLRADAPNARVAVLAWLGYDPPDGLGWAAARATSARAGAGALTDLVRMLVAHRPTASVTLIGHSYGALVVGLAAPDLPRQVTDLVTLGGIGMGVDRVADLRTRATVWAAQAPTDWIQRIPQVRVLGVGHGTRPGEPGFGARALPVDGVAGHDSYLVPGTGTLRALAGLILRRSAESADGPAESRTASAAAGAPSSAECTGTRDLAGVAR